MHDRTATNSVTPGLDAGALLARGTGMLRRGRLNEALECYHAALALQPGLFEAHANLGSGLLALHRPVEAEPHLRRALKIRPDQCPLHLALARACSAQGHLADADAAYARALEIAPDNIEALVERGGVLRRLGRYDAAADHYLRALDASPHIALAHYGLGHCLREQGCAVDAAACFERAIAAQPDYIDAHYRLAVLRPGVAAPERLAQLEALAPRIASMPMAQQTRYWFTLGRLREDDGASDAAFAAYAEGNRLQRQRLGVSGYTPAREAVDARFVQRIRTVFDCNLLHGSTVVGESDPRVPVFIVGMPRSGTSLLEQMLAAHPAVHGGGELPDFPAVLEADFHFDEGDQDTYPEGIPSLAPHALQRLGRAYLERAWAQVPPTASHVTDKLTGNFLHVGMIHRALPQAKVIHIERDLRDSCFSCYANLFKLGNIAYSYDLGTLGRYAVRCRELMRHWRDVLPASAVTTVRYEDLVRDAERELRRVLDFVGLPWHERCLEFHREQRAVRTVSVGQVRRPVYATSVARWQHFERHIRPLLDILEEPLGSLRDSDGVGAPANWLAKLTES